MIRTRWHVNLEVELDDGRIIEIDRDLNDARTTTLDVGMGGREVTDDLMNQGSPDGAKWLGLDRTTFPKTASVNQADVLSILDLGNNERHALQEHLAQAAAGGRGGTAAGAIECIRKFAAGERRGGSQKCAKAPPSCDEQCREGRKPTFENPGASSRICGFSKKSGQKPSDGPGFGESAGSA